MTDRIFHHRQQHLRSKQWLSWLLFLSCLQPFLLMSWAQFPYFGDNKEQSFNFALQPDFSYQPLMPAIGSIAPSSSSLLSATQSHRFQPLPIPLNSSPSHLPPSLNHHHSHHHHHSHPHNFNGISSQQHHSTVANPKPLVTVATVLKKNLPAIKNSNKVQPQPFINRATAEKHAKPNIANQSKSNHTYRNNVPISTGIGSILEPRAQASEFTSQKFMIDPLPTKHMLDSATLEALAQAAYEAGSPSAHLHLKSMVQQQSPTPQSPQTPSTLAKQPQYSQPQQLNYQSTQSNNFQPMDSVAQPQPRSQSKPQLLQVPRLRVLEYEEQHRAALSEFARALEQLDLRSLREHEVKQLPIIDAKHLTGEHLNTILQQNLPIASQDESSQKEGDRQWIQPPSVGYANDPAILSPIMQPNRPNYGHAPQSDSNPVDDEPQSYNSVSGGSRNDLGNRNEYANRVPDQQPAYQPPLQLPQFKPAYVSEPMNSNYGAQQQQQTMKSNGGAGFQPPKMQYFSVNDCPKKRMKQNMPMIVTPSPPMPALYSPATPPSPQAPSPASLPPSMSNYQMNAPMRTNNMWNQFSDFQGSLNQLVSFDDTSNYLSSASAMHRMRLRLNNRENSNSNNAVRNGDTFSFNNGGRNRDWSSETTFGNGQNNQNHSTTYFKTLEESGGNRFVNNRNHHHFSTTPAPLTSTSSIESIMSNSFDNDRHNIADTNPIGNEANGRMFISNLNGNSGGNYSKELSALMEAVMMNSSPQQLLPTKLDMRVIHLPVSVLKRLVGEERRKRKRK